MNILNLSKVRRMDEFKAINSNNRVMGQYKQQAKLLQF